MKPSRSKSRASSPKFGRFEAVAFAIVVIVVALTFVPLPFFTLAPGRALDLAAHVAVEGHAASPARFFLTDVTLVRTTPLSMLIARFAPATEIVPSSHVIPSGQTAGAFDRAMVDAMAQSQNAAAFVAERAAGYRIPMPPEAVVVTGFPPGSRASRTLLTGDRIARVAGRAIGGTADVARAVRALPAAVHAIAVEVVRAGRTRELRVEPMRAARAPVRLGVFVQTRVPAVRLPVPVRFDVGEITGASAGLMFALQIYADLHPRGAGPANLVAGTGTIALDGTVGPIEGTRQKLEAARRAGSRIFFVPRENYADLAHEPGGVRVVPVTSFAQALRFLARGTS